MAARNASSPLVCRRLRPGPRRDATLKDGGAHGDDQRCGRSSLTRREIRVQRRESDDIGQALSVPDQQPVPDRVWDASRAWGEAVLQLGRRDHATWGPDDSAISVVRIATGVNPQAAQGYLIQHSAKPERQRAAKRLSRSRLFLRNPDPVIGLSGSTTYTGRPFRFPWPPSRERMGAGHAPTGDEYSTSSMRCSPTQVRAGGCAVARNEYSGIDACTGSPYCLRWSGSACPAPSLYRRIPHAETRSVRCAHRHRLGRQEA